MIIFLITILILALLLWYLLTSNNPEKSLYVESLACPIDRTLNKKLKKVLSSGICSIDRDSCRIKITFNNSTTIEFWDCERWYNWMREGVVIPRTGDAYIWKDKRPTRRTMLKFKKAIEEYYKTLKSR